MKALFWFGVAGGTGFLVDAGMLAMLLALTPLGPLPARLIAMATAMAATWVLNRSLTFARSGRSLTDEGLRYGFVGTVSAMLNYAIYAGLVLRAPVQPLAALVLSSLAAMAFSYFGYSRFVFRR